jgi:hypothetical protein
MATIKFPENHLNYPPEHTYTRNNFIPEHRVRRWLIPIITGFVMLVAGVAIGSAGNGSKVGNCAELAGEYRTLVSDGIDAGMSMDEGRVQQVAERRDQLAEVMAAECG